MKPIRNSTKKRVHRAVVLFCLTAGAMAFAVVGRDTRGAMAIQEHPDRELADKSGWYKVNERNYLLLTPSAGGGWFVADFGNQESGRIEKQGSDDYVWKHGAAGVVRSIRFLTGDDKRTIAFAWRGKDGNEHTLRKQPEHAYHQQEVFFNNGDLQLSGLLFTPLDGGRAPAAVMIHGSGASDRDNLWYQAIANHLATGGIAVLLPDKRGTGKSQGNWQVASFEDFARDALAAAEFLKPRDDIDPARVGLLGISQGGWIAPLAANLAEDVAFVVNVSGSAVRPNEQLLHELRQTLIQRGGSQDTSSKRVSAMAAIARSRRPTWWKKNGDFDPVPHWRSLPCRALIIYGEDDQHDNVPVVESVERLKPLIAAPGARLNLKVYPNSGHGLRNPDTGKIRQDFLDDLSGWIAQEDHDR